MTNKKATKRALTLSIISMLICVVMLAGTTFAWFTDSVTSGVNQIIAGNLDVELYHEDNDNSGKVDATTKLFNDVTLWEPGAMVWEKLKVVNEGTLALKYNLEVNFDVETATKVGGKTLADVLQVAVLDAVPTRDTIMGASTFAMKDFALNANGVKLDPKGSADNSDEFYVAIYWAPTADDNYFNLNNGKKGDNGEKELKIDLGVKLVATQVEQEYDSFGNDYDKDATYPVTDAAELKEAIAKGGNIVLANDVAIENTTLTVAKGTEVTINLNGNKLSGVNTVSGTSALIKNTGTLNITGQGTVTVLAEKPDTDWNPEGFPTYASNTIANSGVLTIGEGVVIENQTLGGGASYAIDNYAGATLTVNGGTIKQTGGDVAIRMNTASATAENKVTINGGTISGKRAIWIHLAGGSSATAPKVTLEINGGELSGTQRCIYSYSYGNSFANTNITINNGTFNGDVDFGAGYYADKETVTINGGTFNGRLGRYLENNGWEDIAKP